MQYLFEEFLKFCEFMDMKDVYMEFIRGKLVENRPEKPLAIRQSTTSGRLYSFEANREAGIVIDRYCPRNDSWREVKKISGKKIANFALVQLKNRLIIVGGCADGWLFGEKALCYVR